MMMFLLNLKVKVIKKKKNLKIVRKEVNKKKKGKKKKIKEKKWQITNHP